MFLHLHYITTPLSYNDSPCPTSLFLFSLSLSNPLVLFIFPRYLVGEDMDDGDGLSPKSPPLFCFWQSPNNTRKQGSGSALQRRNSGVSVGSGRPNAARLGLIVPNPKKKRNSMCVVM